MTALRLPTVSEFAGAVTLLVLTAVLAISFAGCGGQPRAAERASASKVVVIVMENKNASDVVGSPGALYFNALATQAGLATASFAIRHPSLPNYLALTSGSTHGIVGNCTTCHVSAPNLADQLARAGLGWKGYMEGLPSACFTGATAGGQSGYAKKHNPFAYYDNVARSPAQCHHVVPLTNLYDDLRARKLSTFSLVVPDLCNDSHDCPVSTGDRFLSRVAPQIIRGLGPNGFLIITWDEGNSNLGCCRGAAAGGRIATLVTGPRVRAGARDPTPIDHYGVLRTIEDALRIPRLGGAADAANGSLNGLFSSAPVLR